MTIIKVHPSYSAERADLTKYLAVVVVYFHGILYIVIKYIQQAENQPGMIADSARGQLSGEH